MAEHSSGPRASESDEGVAGPPLVEPSAAAMAVAIGRPSRDKTVNAETAAFLVDQRRMLNLQMEHLHEQRTLQLSRLRWGRFSDRVRAALQIMTAVVGLFVAVGLGGAIWTAARSDSVVVDAFTGPPDLAAKGLTGEVLASRLLDNLTLLQSQTRSAQTKRGLRDAWSSDIKLEVPQTGVSIGELMRDLRAWLGHETHIGGDLVETPQGLSLTVRGEGILPRTFAGQPSDLDRLFSQAAEYVYGQNEPYLFASYLQTVGRDAEAIAFIPSVYQTARPDDRPFLLNAWGIGLQNLGRQHEALAKFQQALRLKPDYWIAYNNIMNSQWYFGDEEGTWKTAEAMKRQAGGRPGRAPEVYYQNADEVVWDLPAFRASLVGDMKTNGGSGTSIIADGLSLSEADVWLHDPAQAELDLATTPGVDKDPTGITISQFVQGYEALERGDYGAAATHFEAMTKTYEDPLVSGNFPGLTCWLAPAEEMSGHPDKADAALAAGGHFVDCYRFRGDILDHRGDWEGAQKAYAAAVAIAPDLPAGYYSWGLALARHGDTNGALAKLSLANERSPHWADPLKAWGDVLAAKGQWSAAAAKYKEALKYAPNWQALRAAEHLAVAKAS